MKLFLTFIFSTTIAATGLAETLLTCKPTSKEGFIKSLVLMKTGDTYSAKMESVMEDGVVDVQLKAPEVTVTATKYILIQDHDLRVTLATYGKRAVVLTESIYDASEPTGVEFLNCR